MKMKYAIAVCILPLGFVLTAVNARSQTFSNITNTTIYSSDFVQSSNSLTGTQYYTPGANGGVVGNYPNNATIHSNSYGTNSISAGGNWATSANGQDGWTNLGVPVGSGPGTIYYSRANADKTNPAGISISADQFYSTDSGNGLLGTYPQSATTYLAQAAYSATGTNAIHFDTTFRLLAQTANNNNEWDTLGWAILNSSMQELLSINLNDISAAADGSEWQLSATAAGSTNKQVLNIPSAGWSTLSGNSITHLGFNILNIGTTNEAVQVLQYANSSTTNLPSVGTQGTYSVLGTTTIDGGTNAASLSGGDNVGIFANTWTLADTNATDVYTNNDNSVSTVYTDFAQNNMLMYSVLISVPEPKTWILFGLSGLALVVYLRKRDA